MRFFTVFLSLSLYFCGISGQSNSQRRFHYGQETAEADPYFAPLLRQPLRCLWCPLEYICGGTWIHETFVLTTAYCLKYHDINRVGYLKRQVTNWANDLEVHGIKRKHYYANYSYEGAKSFENDMGLIQVIIPRIYRPGPFPIIFDSWGNPNAIQREQVVLYGFGRTENGNYAPKLKYMRGRLHFEDDYFYGHCTIPSCHKGQSFCFESQFTRDRADNGDMGSPVYYKVSDPDHPNLKESRVLIGMLSDSYNDPNNMILTNLTYYKNVIDEIIKSG